MTDDPKQIPEPTTTPEQDPEIVSSVRRGRFASNENGSRPFSLYAVLGLGVGALLVLLGIIYFSSMDRDNPDQPICTAISPAVAQEDVRDGKIKRIVVNYNKDIDDATDPKWGPVLSRIDYLDGGCGNLPQGIQERDAITLVLGTVLLYNETTNQPQVEIKLNGSDSLSPLLFMTPTLEPTTTPIPTMTPEATSTPEPTATIQPTVMTTMLAPTPKSNQSATPAASSPIVVTPETSREVSPRTSPEPTVDTSASPQAGRFPTVITTRTATAGPTP